MHPRLIFFMMVLVLFTLFYLAKILQKKAAIKSQFEREYFTLIKDFTAKGPISAEQKEQLLIFMRAHPLWREKPDSQINQKLDQDLAVFK